MMTTTNTKGAFRIEFHTVDLTRAVISNWMILIKMAKVQMIRRNSRSHQHQLREKDPILRQGALRALTGTL